MGDELNAALPAISRTVSGVVLFAILIGVALRRTPRKHIPIMVSAFVVDVLNVVVIELKRDAIMKTVNTAQTAGEWVLKFHVAVSVIAIVCYVVALITGTKLVRGRGTPGTRKLHKRNAGIFLFCRIANFASSFWVGV